MTAKVSDHIDPHDSNNYSYSKPDNNYGAYVTLLNFMQNIVFMTLVQ